MTKTEVLALLRANKNERGMKNWKKPGVNTGGLRSFGIGLTQQRKLAKQIGRDRRLAQTLWKTNVYDAKVIGILIDDPKQMTREQAEQQVEQLNGGMLAHVFSACGAPLAKAPFAVDLASEWVVSKDATRRSCGNALLYEVSKDKRKTAPSDDFFLTHIDRIQKSIQGEENWVKESLLAALMGIGKRNRKLNKAAIKAAKAIGPVEVDYGDTGCEPLDVLKHLTSDYIKKKLYAA